MWKLERKVASSGKACSGEQRKMKSVCQIDQCFQDRDKNRTPILRPDALMKSPLDILDRKHQH